MVRLFVYGSLMTGEENAGELRGARLVGRARTAAGYTLHDLGRYPALVDGGETCVSGELYEMDEAGLEELDRFEAGEGVWRRATIRLEDGAAAEAYLVGPDGVRGGRVVASGDWRRRGTIE
jgi:gamma-glutamylcyclotransferase (GGCT)/AIG2-like uncharacterized protein YtfP